MKIKNFRPEGRAPLKESAPWSGRIPSVLKIENFRPEGRDPLIDFESCYRQLARSAAAPWLETLPAQVEEALDPVRNGHLQRWREILAQLPRLTSADLDFGSATVRAGREQDCDATVRARLHDLLQGLHPWRKGPFSLYGIHIDTEWRSDWKWTRLAPHITPLHGRGVLDIGCGNGYHCWRMLGAGAEWVVGIDPTLISVVQFYAIKHFLGDAWPVWVLPLGIEAVSGKLHAFDTVFSMGVLYHRRSPLDHLFELHGCLRRGGELILETLVLEGREGQVLVPEGRYARMRNVWFIPSVATLEGWLRRCGFAYVRCVDVTPTTREEQRTTPWMRFESLAQQLDPNNPARTVEGLPAPLRAVIIAIRA